MSNGDEAQRVWRMMEKIGFCMLATRDGEHIRSRPMAAHVEEQDGEVHFLTDAESHKEEAIRQHPNVNLAFADAGAQKYVSVTGRAVISNDRQKIRELWSTPAKAWWDSPDDPSLRVLTVRPADAQYWDSPGTVVSYVKMFAAAVSGARPAIGDSGKVTM